MHELRAESTEMVKETNNVLEKKEEALMEQIKMLNERCDNL